MGTNEFYSDALTQKGFQVSTSAIQRHISAAGWKSGTASTVPVLSVSNCQERLEFCRTMLARAPGRDTRTVYLHGDEKVFTTSGLARQRAPADIELHSPGKTNQFKNKIMVFSVVGKPIPEYEFDGIIGKLHVHPFRPSTTRKAMYMSRLTVRTSILRTFSTSSQTRPRR